MATLITAGLRSRALAFVIDAVLLYATLVPLLWLLHQLFPGLAGGWIDKGIARCLPALLVLGCWRGLGATPGLMIFNSRIVDARTGEAMSTQQCLLRWVVFIASALPLGLGFLWVAIDPQRRPLHDSVAGTAVVRPPQPVQRLHEMLLAHWLGELPLAISFWRNTVLPLLPLLLLAVGLTVEINITGDRLRLCSVALLLLWPLILLIAIWGIVGSWRAVAEHNRLDLNRHASMAAQAALGLLAACTLYCVAFEFLPRVGSYLQLAGGNDPVGHAEMTLSSDGGRMTVTGSIGMDDGARFLSQAAAAPGLLAVEIDSAGGRLFEATRMADLIKDKKLHVRVIGRCDGACSLAFLAASHRQIMPGSTVGLSRPSAGILNPVMDAVVKPDLSALFQRYGTPEPFLARMFAMAPNEVWHPSRGDWVDADRVDPMPQTLDVALDTALIEALRDNPGWYWVEQAHPGTIELAAQRMDAARRDPAQGEAQVQAAGQAVISALLPQILQSVRNDLRADYVLIWREQLKAARQQGPAACAGVLSGDAAARRQLPPEVLAQETNWLIRVAMESEVQTPRPVNANEIAVLRHQLSDRAPDLLAGLYASARTRPGALECERTIGILDAVAALPNNVRQVAARALFQ